MKIKLLESVPNISVEQVQQFKNSNEEEKTKIIDQIIKDYNNPDLFKIKDAIEYSCFKNGIDPKSNSFMKFIDAIGNSKVNLGGDIMVNTYLKRLVDLRNKHSIDLDNKMLLNPSLYYRKDGREFDYTVRLLDTVNNPYKLKKFFKDTSNIKVEDLFVNGNKNGALKPVGEGDTSEDTLYGVVERWSGENGENDVADNKKGKNGKIQTPTLTKKQLSDLKNIGKYKDIKEWEIEDPSIREEGNIIYANSNGGPNNINPGFYIFLNNEWQPFSNIK